MVTYNDKILAPNSTKDGLDTIHPETNTGNVYDFINGNWLDLTFKEHVEKIASNTDLGHIKVDGNTIKVDPVTGIASAKGGLTDFGVLEFTSTDGLSYSTTSDKITEYTLGMRLLIKTSVQSTGVFSIKVNDLPSKNVFTATGAPITTGLFGGTSNSIFEVIYNGSFFGIVGDGFGLIDSITNNSKFYAATANAVKTVNDLKANKIQPTWTTGTVGAGFGGIVKYFRDEIGFVHVYFTIYKSTSIVANEVIFSLPSGVRPFDTFNMIALGASGASSVPVALQFQTGGTVKVNYATPSVSVEGVISFRGL